MNQFSIRLAWRSKAMLAITFVLGMVVFTWPLFIDAKALLNDDKSGQTTAPLILGVIMLIVIGVLLVEITGESLDVKALAMLGVLCAVNAVLRPLGTGVGGIETVFFLLVLAGRVFGPGFGLVLGCLSLFASALITAGVGPWLPYQMLAAGFVGYGAGLLPGRDRIRGLPELAMLIGYGVVASFVFGYLVDLAFWPFVFGANSTQAGYDPSASWLRNLHVFLVVNTTTALGWCLVRGITTAVLLGILGKPLLRIFRRTTRRAGFVGTAE
jgi:energy-coupling factor transport system substrate-specific component